MPSIRLKISFFIVTDLVDLSYWMSIRENRSPYWPLEITGRPSMTWL